MWPLLTLSVLAIALAVERAIFWLTTHRPGRHAWITHAAADLRSNNLEHARALAAEDRSVYAAILRELAAKSHTTPGVIALVETQRPRFERFSATLSTIVTAAPLLGILGTVLGIIASFELMAPAAGASAVSDINAVADGIAQALITTAFGLIVALVSLFTAMVCRAHAQQCLGRIETLVEAAQQHTNPQPPTPTASSPAPDA